MQLHLSKSLLTTLLVPFCLIFITLAWLAWVDYPSPFAHAWDLLLHDRIVQLIMVDFAFFFLWVFFWIVDRSKASGRNPLPWLVLGLLVATLMIYVFVLAEERRQKTSAKRED